MPGTREDLIYREVSIYRAIAVFDNELFRFSLFSRHIRPTGANSPVIIRAVQRCQANAVCSQWTSCQASFGGGIVFAIVRAFYPHPFNPPSLGIGIGYLDGRAWSEADSNGECVAGWIIKCDIQ